MNPDTSFNEATPVQKSGKGSLVACIILLVLLIGVSVFAVMTTINAQSTINEIDSLKKDVASRDAKLETVKEVVGVENTEDITTDLIKGLAYDSNYIYFPDAGMKIKISDELTTVSYLYHAKYNSIEIWGVKKGMQYYPDFADPDLNNSSLGIISIQKKSEKNEECSEGLWGAFCNAKYVTDAAIDDYVIVYDHPQAVYSSDKSEIEYETAAVDVIEEMLTNPANYSKI